MRWAKILVIGFMGALPAIMGCGAGAASVGAVKATGTVTFDGKPLEGATIVFIPEGKDGRNASGLTDATGNFRLTTLEPGDGAIPGKYKVTVSKLSADEQAYVPPTSQEEGMKRAAERAKSGGFPTQIKPTKETLPPRYSNETTSGLQAEVKSGSENTFTFPLTTAG